MVFGVLIGRYTTILSSNEIETASSIILVYVRVMNLDLITSALLYCNANGNPFFRVMRCKDH